MSDLIKGINPSGDTQAVAVAADGAIKISGSITASGSDGAILDGVSASIKATVLDYANSNPIAVRLTDTGGDYTAAGAGTQYTEDAAAAANPIGTALILIREDARAGSLVTTDGDNVAARGNNKGELYVKHTDTLATSTEQTLDYDTGAGTATMSIRGIALPASGGPVAGGTSTNPIQVGDAGGNLSIDDGGNSITVDGSLTTVSTVTAVTTITNVVHVDDNSGSLTVDGTVAVTSTPLTTISGAIKNEDVASASADPLMIVGAIQTATPADTAGTDLDYAPLQMSGGRLWVDASGKTLTVAGTVTANAGTNLNTSALALESGGNLATIAGAIKAEDSAHSTGHVGIQMLAVREATATDLSAGNTDGDYEPLQVDANGKLWVNTGTVTVASHAVTNAGTFAVQASEADGANVTLGAKADAKSTSTDTTAISAMSVLKQISASVQAPPSQAVTNAGTFATQAAITAASGSISSGAVASGAVASGAFASGSIASGAIVAGAVAAGASSFVKLEDVASADADAGVPAMAVRKATPANTSGTDGDYEMLQISAGRLWTQTGGSVATNVAIADNPVNQGAQAVSSENTAVTALRQVQLVADLVGKLIVLPYANPENFVSGAITSAMTGTTSTSLVAAPAAGLRNYITQITVSNAHATVGTDVIIQDGSGGTTLYVIPAAAVYGGAVLTFPTPLRQPTTATAIYCANVTTGASTKVSASGYKGV